MFHMNNGEYNTKMIYTYVIYLGKKDIIEVNPYAIQLFQCIWLKGHIQATTFMTVFELHPVAIIRGRLL